MTNHCKQIILIFKGMKRQKSGQDELIIANDELNFSKWKTDNGLKEAIILNNELCLLQYGAKRELASELTIAYTELINRRILLRNYIEGTRKIWIHMIFGIMLGNL